MKLAHFFKTAVPDIKWDLCLQMGVKYAVAKLSPELTGKDPIWHYSVLEQAKESFASRGLELIALEGDQFDMTRIKLGLPGREEDAEHYREMLANMGRLGITTLCYNFMQTGWFRTRVDIKERGGALVTGFDLCEANALPDKEYAPVSAEQVWENYRWFISQVIPAAEESGVRMGLHPDDPPVPSIQGVGRFFTCPEHIDLALSLSDSPSHCLTFCQGTYVTMGADIRDCFHKWKDRVAFVHLRDVSGTAGHFHETFHDDGPTDMPAMLKFYADEGFDGILRSDHVPTMAGEDNDNPSYSMNGSLFGVGYIKGIMDAFAIKAD